MSRRHQVSRRHHYGRRQHEMNELHGRTNRLVAVMDWPDETWLEEPIAVWDLRRDAAAASGWDQHRGIE
jgi:hypothetical protein